jgi:hypothetical protein
MRILSRRKCFLRQKLLKRIKKVKNVKKTNNVEKRAKKNIEQLAQKIGFAMFCSWTMNHLCSYGKSNPRSYMLMQLNYFKHNLSLWWCFEVIDDFQTVESRECSYQTAHFDFFLEVFASCLNSPQTNLANSRIREQPDEDRRAIVSRFSIFHFAWHSIRGFCPTFWSLLFWIWCRRLFRSLRYFASCLNSPRTNSVSSQIRERPDEDRRAIASLFSSFHFTWHSIRGFCPTYLGSFFWGGAGRMRQVLEWDNGSKNSVPAIAKSFIRSHFLLTC